MLEARHFYHVRVVPQPETGRLDLEAVDSMISTTAPLPNTPTTLNPTQPPDREAGSSGRIRAGDPRARLRSWCTSVGGGRSHKRLRGGGNGAP